MPFNFPTLSEEDAYLTQYNRGTDADLERRRRAGDQRAKAIAEEGNIWADTVNNSFKNYQAGQDRAERQQLRLAEEERQKAQEEREKGRYGHEQARWGEMADEYAHNKKKWASEEQEAAYKDEVTQRKHDPNSPETQYARKLASQLSPGNDFSQMSAAEIENQMPMMEKIWSVQENAEAKKTAAKSHSDEMALKRQEIQDKQATDKAVKDEQKVHTALEHMGRDIKGTARDPIGASKIKVKNAEAVEALAKQYPNPDMMPPSAQRELAIAVSNLISPGVAHEDTIRTMDPATFESEFNSMIQKVTGKPIGSGRGEFVKNIAETARREKQLAKTQLASETAKVMSPYAWARKADPEGFDTILRNNEYDPSEFDENFLYKPKERPEEPPIYPANGPGGKPGDGDAFGAPGKAPAWKPIGKMTKEEREAEKARLRLELGQ